MISVVIIIRLINIATVQIYEIGFKSNVPDIYKEITSLLSSILLFGFCHLNSLKLSHLGYLTKLEKARFKLSMIQFVSRFSSVLKLKIVLSVIPYSTLLSKSRPN